MLNARTLLGHGIHLDASERAMIRAAGATIVHCPSSNAFLQSGIMPLRRWLNDGLSIGLGTDVAGGPSLSMWNEMAMTRTVSKLRSALLNETSATVKLAEAEASNSHLDPIRLTFDALIGKEVGGTSSRSRWAKAEWASSSGRATRFSTGTSRSRCCVPRLRLTRGSR